MTDHLPECLHDDKKYGLRGLCICNELRACEQRVREECALKDRNLHAEGYAEGYSRGAADWRAYTLHEAREAIEAVRGANRIGSHVKIDALAAIDALREGEK